MSYLRENAVRWPVRELSAADRPALGRHLLLLSAYDRRLRFGNPSSDAAICRYVQGIDFGRDALFGVFDDRLRLLGAAHVARAPRHAELGVSVLIGDRNCGIGGALLERAVLRARNWSVGALFMHCLRENAAMLHLARKQGMVLATEAGEADAWLDLPRPDAGSFFGEVFAQRAGLLDFALKTQFAQARRLLDALISRHGEVEQAVAAPARH
jgi:hypothetical protein